MGNESLPAVTHPFTSAPWARIAQPVLAILLAAGCLLVLEPFFPAILFAVVIVVSTWPAHRTLLSRMGGRHTAASVVSCLAVMGIAVVPAAMLVVSAGDGLRCLLGLLEIWRNAPGPAFPEWVTGIPLVGEWLQHGWAQALAGDGSWTAHLAEPARAAALASGLALGNGLMQAAVALPLLFLLYRSGDTLGAQVRDIAIRIGGERALTLLATAESTVSGVMLSVIGAALAQATVAILGFAIAGVPNAFMLGAITFVLSMVPIGPPLIWGGAAIWLLRAGEPGWAVFMVVYGVACISSIDNVLKPYLISRSSHLPFALTLIGVIGGVMAFGLMGVFLGPTLLALAIRLAQHAMDRRAGV